MTPASFRPRWGVPVVEASLVVFSRFVAVPVAARCHRLPEDPRSHDLLRLLRIR